MIFDVSLNIDSETVKELFYEKNDKEMKGIVIVDEVELKDFLESQTGYMRNVIELL